MLQEAQGGSEGNTSCQAPACHCAWAGTWQGGAAAGTCPGTSCVRVEQPLWKGVYRPCVPHAAGLWPASLGSVPRKTHGRTACAALAQPSHGAEHLPTRNWNSPRVASFSCGSVGADHQGPGEQCPCQHGRTIGPCMGALRLSPLPPGAASSAPGWWVWGCLCGCPAAGTS